MKRYIPLFVIAGLIMFGMLLLFLYGFLRLFATEYDETEANVLKAMVIAIGSTVTVVLAAVGKVISVWRRQEVDTERAEWLSRNRDKITELIREDDIDSESVRFNE